MPVILPEALSDEIQKPRPAALVWCWQIDLQLNEPPTPSTRTRIVQYNEQIDLEGVGTFYPWPVQQSDLVEDTEGNLPTLTLTLDNRTRFYAGFLLDLDGLIGNTARVWLASTLALRAQDAERLDFRIRSAAMSSEAITLELRAEKLFDVRVPSERFESRRCRWADDFGGEECGYIVNDAAAYTSCSGTLEDCELRGLDEASRRLPVRHPRRWGGFQGIPFRRR